MCNNNSAQFKVKIDSWQLRRFSFDWRICMNKHTIFLADITRNPCHRRRPITTNSRMRWTDKSASKSDDWFVGIFRRDFQFPYPRCLRTSAQRNPNPFLPLLHNRAAMRPRGIQGEAPARTEGPEAPYERAAARVFGPVQLRRYLRLVVERERRLRENEGGYRQPTWTHYRCR